MEASGIGLPVIEAHCEYKSPARYDDELVVKTMGKTAVAGARRVRVRNQPPERRDGQRDRPHRACGDRHQRAPVPAARLHSGAAGMKAVVTGAAGFIGSHLSAALLDSGATVTGIDCFTDYYPRPLKEANLATLQGRPGFTLHRGRAAGHRPQARPRGRHPRLSPGRPGRGPKELGTRFRRLYKEQRRGDSAAARSAGRHADPEIRIRVELVGLRRPRAAAHARRRVFAAACPRMACRSWPPNIWATSTGPTTACLRCRCGTSPCTARDSGRIWDFNGF